MREAKRRSALGLSLWFAAASFGHQVLLAAPPAVVDAQADPVARAQLETLHNRVRYFAVLVENFASNNGAYPKVARARGLEPYRLLEILLPEPEIHRFPATDLEGRDLLYWSDGAQYVVIAVGSDGKPDMDYVAILSIPGSHGKAICRGESGDPSTDVVFVNGQLCTWRGLPKP